MSGLELTRLLKREPPTRELPVIMLTARAAEGDKVAGLDGGADDYITKPFSPRELLSRINAVLRRTGGASGEDKLEIGGVTLDRASHRVTAGETRSDARAHRIPHAGILHGASGARVQPRAAARPGLGRQQSTSRSAPSTCTSAACARRSKRCPMSHLIQTVRGSGYRLSARGSRLDEAFAGWPGSCLRGIGADRAGWARWSGGCWAMCWPAWPLALALALGWQLLNLYWLEHWLRDRGRPRPAGRRAASGATWCRRSCACIGASASTSSACWTCSASCAARRPPCPTASSC